MDETDGFGNSGLGYDAQADRYTYVWKTEKSWAGTCRAADVSPVQDPAGGTSQHIVLIITADALYSRYIADCLGARTDVRPVTAVSATAQQIAARDRPAMVIVDAAHAGVLRTLPDLPAIVIVDDSGEAAPLSGDDRIAPHAALVRPFNTRSLTDQADRMLGARADG